MSRQATAQEMTLVEMVIAFTDEQLESVELADPGEELYADPVNDVYSWGGVL